MADRAGARWRAGWGALLAAALLIGVAPASVPLRSWPAQAQEDGKIGVVATPSCVRPNSTPRIEIKLSKLTLLPKDTTYRVEWRFDTEAVQLVSTPIGFTADSRTLPVRLSRDQVELAPTSDGSAPRNRIHRIVVVDQANEAVLGSADVTVADAAGCIGVQIDASPRCVMAGRANPVGATVRHLKELPSGVSYQVILEATEATTGSIAPFPLDASRPVTVDVAQFGFGVATPGVTNFVLGNTYRLVVRSKASPASPAAGEPEVVEEGFVTLNVFNRLAPPGFCAPRIHASRAACFDDSPRTDPGVLIQGQHFDSAGADTGALIFNRSSDGEPFQAEVPNSFRVDGSAVPFGRAWGESASWFLPTGSEPWTWLGSRSWIRATEPNPGPTMAPRELLPIECPTVSVNWPESDNRPCLPAFAPPLLTVQAAHLPATRPFVIHLTRRRGFGPAEITSDPFWTNDVGIANVSVTFSSVNPLTIQPGVYDVSAQVAVPPAPPIRTTPPSAWSLFELFEGEMEFSACAPRLEVRECQFKLVGSGWLGKPIDLPVVPGDDPSGDGPDVVEIIPPPRVPPVRIVVGAGNGQPALERFVVPDEAGNFEIPNSELGRPVDLAGRPVVAVQVLVEEQVIDEGTNPVEAVARTGFPTLCPEDPKLDQLPRPEGPCLADPTFPGEVRVQVSGLIPGSRIIAGPGTRFTEQLAVGATIVFDATVDPPTPPALPAAATETRTVRVTVVHGPSPNVRSDTRLEAPATLTLCPLPNPTLIVVPAGPTTIVAAGPCVGDPTFPATVTLRLGGLVVGSKVSPGPGTLFDEFVAVLAVVEFSAVLMPVPPEGRVVDPNRFENRIAQVTVSFGAALPSSAPVSLTAPAVLQPCPLPDPRLAAVNTDKCLPTRETASNMTLELTDVRIGSRVAPLPGTRFDEFIATTEVVRFDVVLDPTPGGAFLDPTGGEERGALVDIDPRPVLPSAPIVQRRAPVLVRPCPMLLLDQQVIRRGRTAYVVGSQFSFNTDVDLVLDGAVVIPATTGADGSFVAPLPAVLSEAPHALAATDARTGLDTGAVVLLVQPGTIQPPFGKPNDLPPVQRS